MLGIVVGHTPKRSGAYNSDLKIKEYDLNEELAFEILKECNRRRIEYKLIYRLNGYWNLARDINNKQVTHCICVHHNSSSKKEVQGTETLYWKFSKVSDRFAKYVNDNMVKALGFRNRGLLPRTQGENGGHVLRNTKMPCILIEPYFMSNNKAVKNRDPKKLAIAIVDGYEDYLNRAEAV